MGIIKDIFQFLSAAIITHNCSGCDEPLLEGMCENCIALLPIADHYCVNCGTYTKERTQCGRCLLGTPPFEAFVAACRYTDDVRNHVMNLKYRGQLYSASILGQVIAHAVKKRRQELPLPSAIIPVPNSNKRLLRRGYNQAEEIARVVSRALDIPIIKPMKKVRHTPSQVKLSHSARRKNVKNAFVLKKPMTHQHVAIIDDVVTTGATMQAVKAALPAHVYVEAWCAAKVVR